MGGIWRGFRRTATVIEVGLAIIAIPVGGAIVASGGSHGWWLVGGGIVFLIAAGLDAFAHRSTASTSTSRAREPENRER